MRPIGLPVGETYMTQDIGELCKDDIGRDLPCPALPPVPVSGKRGHHAKLPPGCDITPGAVPNHHSFLRHRLELPDGAEEGIRLRFSLS